MGKVGGVRNAETIVERLAAVNAEVGREEADATKAGGAVRLRWVSGPRWEQLVAGDGEFDAAAKTGISFILGILLGALAHVDIGFAATHDEATQVHGAGALEHELF